MPSAARVSNASPIAIPRTQPSPTGSDTDAFFMAQPDGSSLGDGRRCDNATRQFWPRRDWGVWKGRTGRLSTLRGDSKCISHRLLGCAMNQIPGTGEQWESRTISNPRARRFLKGMEFFSSRLCWQDAAVRSGHQPIQSNPAPIWPAPLLDNPCPRIGSCAGAIR